MTRVGIVMFQNMRYAPFLKLYEDILSSISGISYDIIFYNRDDSLGEINDEKHIAISWQGKGTLTAPGYERVVNFGLYPFKVKRILKKKQYDFLIILTTFPAVLLQRYLSRNYKDRYLVDIRDYTHENLDPYYCREVKVLMNAAMRVISSPGFVNFLPKADYLICHNFDVRSIPHFRQPFRKATGRSIIVSYIGTISYKKQCKQLIELVQKDNRFKFYFYGNEADDDEIQSLVKELKDERIKYMGPFLPRDKERIYMGSDLVFNCYGTDGMLVKYAISNKYYDAALYRKPLLVSPRTSMAEESGAYAFSLDLDSAASLDELYDWYVSIEADKYEKYSDEVINKAVKDNEQLKARIKNMITGIYRNI